MQESQFDDECMILFPQELVQKRCHIAVDFEAELMKWTDDSYYAANVHKIQLPYNQVLTELLLLIVILVQ
jgi:hypothetical protein